MRGGRWLRVFPEGCQLPPSSGAGVGYRLADPEGRDVPAAGVRLSRMEACYGRVRPRVVR